MYEDSLGTEQRSSDLAASAFTLFPSYQPILLNFLSPDIDYDITFSEEATEVSAWLCSRFLKPGLSGAVFVPTGKSRLGFLTAERLTPLSSGSSPSSHRQSVSQDAVQFPSLLNLPSTTKLGPLLFPVRRRDYYFFVPVSLPTASLTHRSRVICLQINQIPISPTHPKELPIIKSKI